MREKIELKNTRDFPIGIFDQSRYYSQSHHHIEFELFYLTSGDVVFGIDGEEVNLHAGDSVFIQPNVDHYIKNNPNNKYHFIAMVFDPEVLGTQGDKIRTIFENIRIYRYINLSDEIVEKIKQASKVLRNNEYGKEFILKSVLFDIISYAIETKQYMEVGKNISGTATKGINSLDCVLAYITEHYREPISLDDVMDISSYSKSHFIRLFKKHVGVNLTDYINQYRIEKACLDLIYTTKNITQVAIENGFNTVQYFSKIFKDYMKCTPKQYQKKGKHLTVPSSIVTADAQKV